MRRDQHRGAVPRHVGENQTHDLPPHHRVETVHRLIQNQRSGAGADGQVERRLLLHSLGKPADGRPPGKLEHVVQLVEKLIVKGGVNAPVELSHILQRRGGVVENLVGDIADGRLHGGIFIDRLTVHGDTAAVRAVDAGEVPDGGGLARAVGADKAVDPPARDGQGQVVQRLKIAEGLGHILHFKHVYGLPSRFWPPARRGSRPWSAAPRRLRRSSAAAVSSPVL